MEHILTVTQLTANIKAYLETGFDVLWVAGEISNLRRPGSGHLYFTLKDEGSQVRAVVFRRSAAAIGFDMEEGLAIICRARLSVYVPRGEYQLIVEAAEPRGIGTLQIAFEQLKRRLDVEGLFDKAHKQPLPLFPEKIGIVTSPTGAAIRDILNITKRRFPSGDILIVPVRVQGVEAAAEIAHAVGLLNTLSNVDVIIVTRGGGSIEDLYPFNDERVARAIYQSRIPVVSAVGHEIDFTIADFTADLRAPTPSAAAEIVVPDRRELRRAVVSLGDRMARMCRSYQQSQQEQLRFLAERLVDPRKTIRDLRLSVDDMREGLARRIHRSLAEKGQRLQENIRALRRYSPKGGIAERRYRVRTLTKDAVFRCRYCLDRARQRLNESLSVLESLNPLSVLRRGYSIARQLPEGKIIREVTSLTEGTPISVQVATGTFHAHVTTIMKESGDGGKEI